MLIWTAPPSDLARYIIAFVHRNEPTAGNVVRVLPEVRASIQIMLADPYWLRGRERDARWAPLPRIALWAPKYTWCYGFAEQHVKAFAVGLTALGLRFVTGVSATAMVDTVNPLSVFAPILASELDPVTGEDFEPWRERAIACLRHYFLSVPSMVNAIEPALAVLATEHADAVQCAAKAVGLSERQFRRSFSALYGVSPKRYQRTLHVDRLLRQLHEAPWEDDPFGHHPLTFSDQAHAIREFRALTGLTPGEYARCKRGGDATLRSAPVTGVAPPPPVAQCVPR